MSELLQNLLRQDQILRLEKEGGATLDFPPWSAIKAYHTDSIQRFLYLPLYVRSLGGPYTYRFTTFEVSPHYVYAICENVKKYPFLENITFLQFAIDTKGMATSAFFEGMAKLIQVVDANLQPGLPSGFLLKIVQQDAAQMNEISRLCLSQKTSDSKVDLSI